MRWKREKSSSKKENNRKSREKYEISCETFKNNGPLDRQTGLSAQIPLIFK